MPTHSCVQWSTAMKTVALPSRVVRQAVRVGPPHFVGVPGGDRAVVVARPAAAPDPGRGEQARLPHQPQHPAPRRAYAGQAQPRPGLAVALADERRAGEHRANLLGQRRVRPCLLRSALRRRLRGAAGPSPPRVDRRAGNLPHPADAGRAVAACCGGRAGPAHRLDLRRAKGSPGLRCARALEQQLVVHRDRADLGLQAADLVVAVVGRPALERGLTGGEEALTPLRQRRSGHPELARERVELLAVQQPQHRLCLASRREATALPPRLAPTIRPLR